jgi:PAS domain S-box-containing protein
MDTPETDRKNPWQVREEVGAEHAAFEKRLQETAQRTAVLHENGTRADMRHVAELALHELTTALEELRVSSEELRAQNEALVEAQVVFEAEQRRYRELFELAPDAYFVTSADGTIQEANRAALELLGTNEGYVRGKPLVVFVAEAERRGFRSLVNRLRSGARAQELELWLSPRNRTPVQVGIRAIAARGPDRSVAGIRWLLRDLTDRNAGEEIRRKLTHEQAVREGAETAARRFRFLAETGRQLVSSLNTQDTLQSVADAAARFLADYCIICVTMPDGTLTLAAEAYRSAERAQLVQQVRQRYHVDPSLEGGPLQRAVRTGTPQLLPEIPAVLLEGGDAGMIYRVLRKLGSRYGMVLPLIVRGRVVGAMGYLATESASFGVPDLRLAEEIAVRVALAIEQARLYAEAENANRDKADFLAVISHELRTPLTAVIGYTELLLSGIGANDPNTSRQFLERIRVSAWHQLGLVEEILIHARLEAAPDHLEMEVVDAAEILRQSAHFITPAAAQKGLQLEVDVPEDFALRTNGGKLRQILINLLTNAVKFTSTGTIRVSLVQDADQVLIQVSDTGSGIAPEHLEAVFERFWQADPAASPSRVRGVGLGLSVCRRAVQFLGGSISVQSTPGSGTTFTVRLPANT